MTKIQYWGAQEHTHVHARADTTVAVTMSHLTSNFWKATCIPACGPRRLVVEIITTNH